MSSFTTSTTSRRRRALFALTPLMCAGVTMAQPGGGGFGGGPGGGPGGRPGGDRPGGQQGPGSQGQGVQRPPFDQQQQGKPGGQNGPGAQGAGMGAMGDLARCATDGSDAAITVTSDPSNDDMWRITSTGCPNWDWSGNKTPGYAGVQSYELQVPKQPIINSTPTMLNNVNNNIKGMVGIAKNGLAMFNGLDAEDRNAYEYEGLTFDQCGAHAAPMNMYHLHNPATPTCCLGYVEGQGHSPAIGVMADGIAVYGPLDVDGKPPTDLDECGAHVDSEHPFLHYHVPSDDNGNIKFPYGVCGHPLASLSNSPHAPRVPHSPASCSLSRYLANCLHGCVTSWPNRQLSNVACSPADEQYDYSTQRINWDATPVSTSTIESCQSKYTFDVTPKSGGGGGGGGGKKPNRPGKRPGKKGSNKRGRNF